MGAVQRGWRWSLVVMLTGAVRLSAQAPTPTPTLSPFARQKAELLLRDKLSCLGCHQLGATGGRLAPALDGVQQRRSAEYIAAMIRDPQSVVPGTIMPRPMLLAGERELIIRYFGGAPMSSGSAGKTFSAAPSASGVGVAVDTSSSGRYLRLCAGCHGAKGNGDGANARYLPVVPTRHADATAMAKRSDDALFDTVHGGGAIMNRSARMPAFGGSLTTDEIRGLVRYIRTLCQCEGPAWSRDGGHGAERQSVNEGRR